MKFFTGFYPIPHPILVWFFLSYADMSHGSFLMAGIMGLGFAVVDKLAFGH